MRSDRFASLLYQLVWGMHSLRHPRGPDESGLVAESLREGRIVESMKCVVAGRQALVDEVRKMGRDAWIW